MQYRKLTDNEIEVLLRQGCSCGDWSQVEVAEGFDASRVVRTTFSGEVRIGRFDKDFTLPGGLVRRSSISDATLHNVSVGDGCCIRCVREYIANYDIADGVFIDNVGMIATEGESTFGNGLASRGP